MLYQLGKNIVMQNGDGPYRKRYDEAKLRFAQQHSDSSKAHAANHAEAMAIKLFVKKLWMAWNPRLIIPQQFSAELSQ
jgi:hypothetical protein